MAGTEIVSLNGVWNYVLDTESLGVVRRFHDPDINISGWSSMKIPNNWQLAGVDNYSGVVWFRRTFTLPEEFDAKHVFVRFAGVDYFAKVWLNGCLLGEHEGYFQPFEFMVDEFIRRNDVNTLVVRVASPREEPGTKWPSNKRLIKGIFSHHDTRPGSWDLVAGQDLGTGGIWNDVELVATGDIRIAGMHVTPTLLGDGTARARISFGVVNYSLVPHEAEVRTAIVPDNFAGPALDGQPRKVWLQPGANRVNLVEPIAEPRLWWTWDHGEPNLYRAEVEVSIEDDSDVSKTRFGLRTFSEDRDGNWHLNGRRIFIRGTNVIPTQWLSEYDPDMIAADIALLRQANVNGVRVHAHVNRQEFYEACDEAGILVWQDFALQWSYDEAADMVDSAVSQIIDMVDLLYNHPSICIWCCHNEPSVNRDSLDRVLYDTVTALDSSRLIKSHSDFKEHPYHGWYYGHVAEYAQAPGGPVISEYGAQALPNLETMKEMLEEGKLWPPDWREWAYRDFQYDQTFNVAGVCLGRSIEEFIQNSQAYQSMVLKAATESYRRAKFTRIGSLFQFMFMDCWPSITWSVVDYYRRPKRGYFALKRAFQPVLPCVVREREKIARGQHVFKELWIVNDFARCFPGAVLEVSLEDERGGIHLADALTVNIPANEAAAVFVTWPKDRTWVVTGDLPAGKYTLKLVLKSREGMLLGENEDPVEIIECTGTFNMDF